MLRDSEEISALLPLYCFSMVVFFHFRGDLHAVASLLHVVEHIGGQVIRFQGDHLAVFASLGCTFTFVVQNCFLNVHDVAIPVSLCVASWVCLLQAFALERKFRTNEVRVFSCLFEQLRSS